MKNNLLFDFKVDKKNQTVVVTRGFDAEKDLVWDAFTKQELLDQWWAPKPWVSRTKYMHFEEGGKRFYAMVSPEGAEHWSIQKFSSINPTSSFSMWDAFADEAENPQLPGSDWKLDFNEQDGTTTVNIIITHDSLEQMEKMLAMGFQGGFTMGLQQLADLLASLKKD